MTAQSLTRLLPDLSDPGHVPFADAARSATDPAAARAAELEQARRDGYAAGAADAVAAAEQQRAALAAALTDRLRAVADEARAAVADELAAQASDIASAAWEIAAWALGRELATDPTALTGAVDAALADLDIEVEVTVYAHPDAIETLTRWARAHTPAPLRLLPDATLAVGELRAATSNGSRIEATVTEIGRRALARLVSTATAAEEHDAR